MSNYTKYTETHVAFLLQKGADVKPGKKIILRRRQAPRLRTFDTGSENEIEVTKRLVEDPEADGVLKARSLPGSQPSDTEGDTGSACVLTRISLGSFVEIQ